MKETAQVAAGGAGSEEDAARGESSDCSDEDELGAPRGWKGGRAADDSSRSDMEFNAGQRIEVKDYRTDMWYMAKIMEVDYDDREIFIHYERWSQRFDEWLKWDSQRIRRIRSSPASSKFKSGENVLAAWNYTQKYPAIVQNVLPNDKYEVLFYDGFLKVMKGNRITKLNSSNEEIMSKLPKDAPRAPPIGADLDVRNIGTKEERRQKKRRLNVVELLSSGKKRKADHGECPSPHSEDSPSASAAADQPAPKRKYRRRGMQAEAAAVVEEGVKIRRRRRRKNALVKDGEAGAGREAITGVSQGESSQDESFVEAAAALKERRLQRVKAVEMESESSTELAFTGFDAAKKSAELKSPIKDVKLKDILPNSAGRRTSKRGRIPKLKTSLGGLTTIPRSSSAFPKIKRSPPYVKSERKVGRPARRLKRQEKMDGLPRGGAFRRADSPDGTEDGSQASSGKENADRLSQDGTEKEEEGVSGDVDGPPPPKLPSSSSDLMDEELRTLINNTESELRESGTESDETETPAEEGGATPERSPRKGVPGKKRRKKRRQRAASGDKMGLKITPRRKNDEEDDPERWNGDIPDGAKPVFIDGGDGKMRQSIIIPDKKLPNGWTKHTIIRKNSSKWDVLLVNKRKNSESKKPAGGEDAPFAAVPSPPPAQPPPPAPEEKRVKTLMPKTKPPPVAPPPPAAAGEEEAAPAPSSSAAPSPLAAQPPLASTNSASSLCSSPSLKSSPALPVTPKSASSAAGDSLSPLVPSGGSSTPEGDGTGSCQCPKEGCGKNFRKENLLQMHIKHYHPEYNKFLDCALNVADLAYARTVGEPLDETVGAVSVLERISKYEANRKAKQAEALPSSKKAKAASLLAHSPLRKALMKGITGSPERAEELGEIAAKITASPVSGIQAARERMRLDGSESDTGDGEADMVQALQRTPVRDASEKLKVQADEAGDHVDGKLQPAQKEGVSGALTPLAPGSSRTRGASADETAPESPTAAAGPSSGVAPAGGTPNTSYRFARKKSLYVNIEKFNFTTDSNGRVLLDKSGQPGCDPVKMPGSADSVLDSAEQDLSADMLNCTETECEDVIKKEEIINCMCGYPEEDGLMIQCDLCLCWQHGLCNNITKESDVPEKYVCYICQHPRHLRASHKYNHSQDWLKEGKLPSLSFRHHNQSNLQQKESSLKRSHEVVATLLQLQKVVQSIRLKIHIAGKVDHPKLYLWAKSWCKDGKQDVKVKEGAAAADQDSAAAKAPQVPVPEAPIDLVECRLRLLEHIEDYQQQIDSRLMSLEAQVVALESQDPDLASDETPDFYPQTKQTVQMLKRDLTTVRKVASLN